MCVCREGGCQWLWQSQNVHWLFHVRRPDQAQWYWLCSLSLSNHPPFPFLPPICPSFFLSPSSHYRWRGQLHSVIGVSGGQRGPPDHPYQCFRHQPKVSVIPLLLPSVPSAFCLSLFPLRWGMSCLAPGKVTVMRWTSLKTHTHWARQLVQLTHIRWVITRHTGDMIDSSDSWKDAISDPSLPVLCIHPRSSHPSIPLSLS